MTATANIQVAGVRDAIRSLNKIEPGLRKQFTQDVTEVAKPAIEHVQESYNRVPLSGMNRKWSSNGRKLFPFVLDKAKRGVKVKLDANRTATAIINIQQTDPGTAAFETAGRANVNRLGQSLGAIRPGHTRILGPAVFRRRRQVEGAIADLAKKAVQRVNEELR